MRVVTVLFIMVFVLNFSRCDRDFSTHTDLTATQPAVGYLYSVLPTIGTTETQFKIAAMRSGGLMTTHEFLIDYQVVFTDKAVDYETEWTTLNESVFIQFESTGKHYVHFRMRGKSGAIYAALDSLYVQDIYPLTENQSNFMQGNVDWCHADPNKIAFDCRDESAEHKIFSYQLDSHEFVQHTFNPADGVVECHQFPVWSPNGHLIAFANNSTREINIVDTATNDVHSLDIPNSFPLDWSPGGDKLLILLDRTILAEYNFFNSSITHIADNCRSACFSPDAHKIAALMFDSYSSFFHIYDASKIDILNSFKTCFAGYKASWSPHAEWLCTGCSKVDEKDCIAFLNLFNEQNVTFSTPELQFIFWPDWSPDGRTIAVEAKHRDENKTKIWAIDLPGELFH